MQPYNYDEIRSMLKNAKSIAIVGAKDKPGQAVDNVGRYLIEAGYKIFPVHPVRKSVWGLEAYKTLADIPCQIDIVNLFRASEYCEGHADEVLALPFKPELFWMQLGITSVEACTKLVSYSIKVVEDKCIMVEHRNLLRVSS